MPVAAKARGEKRAALRCTYVEGERQQATLSGTLVPERGMVGSAVPKQAMADAHPDRGGTNAAFIKARAAYVAVRRGAAAEKLFGSG